MMARATSRPRRWLRLSRYQLAMRLLTAAILLALVSFGLLVEGVL